MRNARQWLWLKAIFLTALMVTLGTMSHAAPASKPRQDTPYTVSPTPSWVKPLTVDAAQAAKPLPPGSKARRDILFDVQVQLADNGKQATYQHFMNAALDSSTLRDVSEPTITFNPAYQKLAIHTLNVYRDGKRSDRLKDVRIEIMRREQALEQQMLDGLYTALISPKDVRVGDVVEVAYSLEGANPIFEGKYSGVFHIAGDAPIDRLHLRLEAPSTRVLQVKGIATNATMERFQEAGRQVLRFQGKDITAIQAETNIPPWFKVYPALHVSEYKSWKEVDQWAQGLFVQEPPSGELAQRIADWKAKGLPRETLLSEVLSFVQDDIRYFSMSLGESAHRPKPAARTLSERMGDCKDKVLLLNTLLTGLGFEAKPVLVSVMRNRGITQFLPSHDQFDHVISMVELDGQRHFLDATLQGQGRTLRNRGYYPRGAGLVVGQGEDLEAIGLPDFALDKLSYQQEWDLSDVQRPAQLTVRMTARGQAAEQWRAAIANSGLERLSQSIAGGYVRVFPGLKPTSPPALTDSRDSNELELVHHFELPQMGEYKSGLLQLDLVNLEFGDVLTVPPEARRNSPFLWDHTHLIDAKINLRAPRAVPSNMPAPTQVSGKHFTYSTQAEARQNELTIRSRYEQRSDEVLPADLETFRDKITQARQNTGRTLRMLLVDRANLEPMGRNVEQRVRRFAGTKPDALLQIVGKKAFELEMADAVLPQLPPSSPLALTVLNERAFAHNLLGEFRLGLQDANTVLASIPADPQALEARGVALMGLNRAPDASPDFEKLLGNNQQGSALWLATSQYMQDAPAKAEGTLQQQLGSLAGEERIFALIWLHLAAERQQAGKGKTAVGSELAGIDGKTWPGVILHHLSGKRSRDDLLLMAREEPEQERLRMAEAAFFIGEQQLIQGQPEEARQWFERAVQTKATPYREVTLARVELKKLGANLSLEEPALEGGTDATGLGGVFKSLGQGLGKVIKTLNLP